MKLASHAPTIDPAHETPKTRLAREQLAKALKKVFRKQRAKAAKKAASMLKASRPDDFADEIFDAISSDFLDIPVEAFDPIADAAMAGVGKGILELQFSDAKAINRINQIARDWASDRAAEMVGMSYGADGELIENPDAKWAISDTTREQLRVIVRDAFSDETKMPDLVQRIQDAGAFQEWRAERIAKQEVSRAQSKGNLAVWKETGAVESSQWLMSDDHTSEIECGCLIGSTLVSTGQVHRVFRRLYSGDLIEIDLGDGHKLTGTPNHPVLTDVGWKPLGGLSEGDKVIHREALERFGSIANDLEKMESRLQDKFTSFLALDGSTRPINRLCRSIDFHGDGIGSHVYTVATNSFLHSKVSNLPADHIEQFAFKWRIKFSAFLSSYRDYVVGMFNSLHSFFREKLFIEDNLAFAVSPKFVSCPPKPSRDSNSTYSVANRNISYRQLFGKIEIGEFIRRSIGSTGFYPIGYRRVAFTKTIVAHDVPVFNVTTNSGIFAAEGIITHNCEINDGEIVDVGDTFPDGSESPPDPHVGCECVIVAVDVRGESDSEGDSEE